MQDDSSKRRASVAPALPTAHSASPVSSVPLADLEPVMGYHVVLRLSDDRVIAASAEERRAAACIMIRHGQARRMLACAVVDTEAHAILLCTRAKAGDYAGRTATALRSALSIDVAFDRARLKPIRDQHCLANAFDDVLRQDQHRALSTTDFHDGTNLPDLVGLRVNGAYSRVLLRAHLPRTSERALLDRLQVDWSQSVAFEASLLIEATLAATGRSSLRGRTSDNVAARSAAATVAQSHMSAPALAKLFGINVRTAFRMRAARCDQALVSAIELQMRWRALRSRA